MHHIFKMKHKNKTTDVTHSPKPWLVTCGNFTDYMLSHVHPSTWSFTWLVFFFLFVFKSALLTYNFGMINCVHSTCTVWWVLTDVHACEIPQSQCRTFSLSSKDCAPVAVHASSAPGHRHPLCALCHYVFPLLEVHINAVTQYVAFCV